MKTNIISAIKLTLLFSIFFCGIYSVIIYGIAQFAPNNGKGDIVAQNGKMYYSNIGQSFTEDKYFNSRPSAVNYKADGSAGSNKSTSNPEYLKEIDSRIQNFLAHNPGIKKSEIPADLITASGSGLDPHLSVEAAKIQVNRIAKIRNLNPSILLELIHQQTEKPLLGLFGTEKINIIKINLILDSIK
ncbi:MAG: K(+)-transporting ATPase subunit C [Sphingobacteriaceae bacterium]|nr:K(+)-transporting ATPase subunit C [Sphingobacteriaceae bacterium]